MGDAVGDTRGYNFGDIVGDAVGDTGGFSEKVDLVVGMIVGTGVPDETSRPCHDGALIDLVF